MYDELEVIEYRDYKITLFRDLYPWDPREWDNLGRMLCAHKRYDLGDPVEIAAPGWSKNWSNYYTSWIDIRRAIEKEFDPAIILPVYMLDHSGITVQTRPFSCPWDSGQIGYIYAAREDVLQCYSRKRLSKKLLGLVREVLESEVKDYDNYVTGDSVGFVVKAPDDESIESVSGYLGYREVRDYVIEEAQHIVDWHIKKQLERRAERIKDWIKHDVPLIHRESLEYNYV